MPYVDNTIGNAMSELR